MTNSQIGSVPLIGATLAGGLAFLLIPAGLLWIASLIGLILLLVLLAYDGDEKRSILQTVTFSAVCGLCATLASAAIYELLFKGVAPEFPQLARTWLPITYVCATVLILLVDFARMTARTGPAPLAGALYSPMTTASSNNSKSVGFVPYETQPAPPPVVHPPSPAITHQEPIEPHLVRNSEPARPAPEPVPVKPGKETNIYVNLVGEGLNMLRAVRAEHLGRDYYRITEPMPESEKWEYGPGQVVRCRKKNLSSGKAMVAVEEAPRAS
ncbi:MAG: hypothetical protein JO185_18015 [Acidobacteriaceae bacterium]|nr:hypothetical protein [Acidobacteriaceae bacterium]